MRSRRGGNAAAKGCASLVARKILRYRAGVLGDCTFTKDFRKGTNQIDRLTPAVQAAAANRRLGRRRLRRPRAKSLLGAVVLSKVRSSGRREFRSHLIAICIYSSTQIPLHFCITRGSFIGSGDRVPRGRFILGGHLIQWARGAPRGC